MLIITKASGATLETASPTPNQLVTGVKGEAKLPIPTP